MEVKAGKHFWEITNFTKGQQFANLMKTVLQMSAVPISPNIHNGMILCLCESAKKPRS